jgi:hypothetical protein
MRAGAYNAHISQQYVKKLGQLIYIRFTQEPADARNAYIILFGRTPVGFGIYDHRPEFDAGE